MKFENKDMPKPRIVMTLLVRDEEDILAENIEYHRTQGVDHIIVTDNLSIDATPKIIKEYTYKGIVTPIFEPTDDYSQSEWVTRMARLAKSNYDADWVINSDADEFWTPTNNLLPDFFAKIDGEIDVVVAQRFDFVFLGDSLNPWYDSMVYRKKESTNFGKPLPPKVAHRANPNIVVKQGNHAVTGNAGKTIKAGELEILHFPMRTIEQFENKIKKGGAALQRNSKLAPTVAHGWRILFEQYRQLGNLRSYCEKKQILMDEVKQGVKDGNLLIDRRLASFFADHEMPQFIDRDETTPLKVIWKRLKQAGLKLKRGFTGPEGSDDLTTTGTNIDRKEPHHWAEEYFRARDQFFREI